MNINTFTSNFDGGARSNLFKIQITSPAHGAAFPYAGDAITVYVKSIQLPEHSLGEIPVNHMGRIYKYPGDRVYNDISLTVLSDHDMKARHFFEAWNEAWNQHQSNTGKKPDPAAFNCEVNLQQLGRDHTVVRDYKLSRAWCSDVSPVDLSYDNNDALVEFTATIKYHFFTVTGKGGNLTA
jgi:hypothetical protein